MFKVIVDGKDLVVRDVRCTCFGGVSDPQDNGNTASGVSTKDPAVLGVALPRRYEGSHHALRRALGDSPLPKSLPFLLPVEITERATGRTFTAPFIDLGPDLNTGNGLDVTVAVAKHFNPKASATNFEMRCDYRILGGAEFT